MTEAEMPPRLDGRQDSPYMGDSLFVPERQETPTPEELKRMLWERQKQNALRSLRANMDEAEQFRKEPTQNRDQAAAERDKPHDTAADSIAGTATRRPETRNVSQQCQDSPAIRYAAIKRAHEEKKRSGGLDPIEDIEYLRAEQEERARLEKLAQDEAYDLAASHGSTRQNSPATNPKAHKKTKRKQYKQTYVEDNDEDGNGHLGLSMGHRAKRRKTKVPATGLRSSSLVYDSDEIDETLRRAQTMQRQEEAGIRPRRQLKKSRGSGSRRNAMRPDPANLAGLMASNVFADRSRVEDLEDQPVFSEHHTQRARALRDLVSSVPLQNRHQAQYDSKNLDEAIRQFTGQRSVVPSKNGEWEVKGMKTTLKAYQVTGVGFMRQRERESLSKDPRGGILADDMGLGKTLQALTCIVNGLKPKGQQPRTTLIVASPALIAQWDSELRRHCHRREEGNKHGIGRIVHHRAGFRQSGTPNDIIKAISLADVAFTTYSEVSSSYPKASPPIDLISAEEKADWWRDHYEKYKGIFHSMRFQRVIFDEAHALKNPKSKSFAACRSLEAEYYWAITGTPAMNGIHELYPYMRLLRVPHTPSFATFKDTFCTPGDDEGADKLAVVMRQIMIRRTHGDTMFGARLLNLPKPTDHVVYLEFSPIERTIYNIVKARYMTEVRKVVEKGSSSLLCHSTAWTLLLRLRQLCSHVLLAQKTILDVLHREDYEKLDRMSRDAAREQADGEDMLICLARMLENASTMNKTTETDKSERRYLVSEESKIPITQRATGSNDANTGGMHGKTIDFSRYIGDIRKSEHWSEIVKRTACSACKQEPFKPVITSCDHIYCSKCIVHLQHYAARRGYKSARCTQCGTEYTNCYELSDLGDPAEAYGDRSDDLTIKKAVSNSWIESSGPTVASAKSRAMKMLVLNWLKNDPTTKIIVYSQFLDYIRLAEKICISEGWDYVKYTGRMDLSSREKALKEFKEKPEKNLMLASLKCGGLGLNLTCASQVIIVDPYWNSLTEQQAFCRVFRIGQTKETCLTRLVVKNTIDEGIQQLKQRKDKEIDGLMANPKLRDQLTTEEIMDLLGGGEDEDGDHTAIYPVAQTDQHPFVPDENETRDNEEAHLENEL